MKMNSRGTSWRKRPPAITRKWRDKVRSPGCEIRITAMKLKPQGKQKKRPKSTQKAYANVEGKMKAGNGAGSSNLPKPFSTRNIHKGGQDSLHS